MAQNTINSSETDTYSDKDFETVDRNVRLQIIGILLVILAALLASFFLLKNLWENQRTNRSIQNQKEVKKQLDDLWDSQEYYRFGEYYVASGISQDSGDTFAEYKDRYNVAECYEAANNEIMSLKITGLDLEEKTVTENIAKCLIDFYDVASKDEDKEIVALMDGTLENYFFLLEEEVETVHKSKDTAEIQEVLRGGLERGKEKKY